MTNGYDSYLRRTNLTALNGTTPLVSTAYGYDQASRLATVSDGANTANYSYVANSSLVGQNVFKNGGNTRMMVTKQYDLANRLKQISSSPSASGVLPFTCNYNLANQRSKNALADGSYCQHGYDSLGRVTNGSKYFANGAPVAGRQFNYAFDSIGNRIQTKTGGDQISM